MPAHAEFPGFGAELGIASQPGGAIGQVQARRDRISQGVLRPGKGTSGAGEIGRRAGDVWLGLVNALLATHPFCCLALVIVTVTGKAVAVGAEQDAILVKAAYQASVGILVILGMERTDGAQGMQFVVDKFQDFGAAFPSVAEQFPNFQVRETFEQIAEAWDGEQMVVAIGRGAGAGERPDEPEPVVDEVEGFGFVAEVMLAVWSGSLFWILE